MCLITEIFIYKLRYWIVFLTFLRFIKSHESFQDLKKKFNTLKFQI